MLAIAVVNVTPPSLASQLLQVWGTGERLVTQICRSRLAGDSDGECDAAIAGKPAPTGLWGHGNCLVSHKFVGAGLLAIAIAMVNVMPPSLASQLLQVCGVRELFGITQSVGAGLLAIAMVNVMPPSLASRLLQVCGVRELFGITQICGSRLAGDSDGECDAAIAGKPAPTGLGCTGVVRHHPNP